MERVIQKTETLVESGSRMRLDSREALLRLRQAEAIALAERRKQNQQEIHSPFINFLRFLFHS